MIINAVNGFTVNIDKNQHPVVFFEPGNPIMQIGFDDEINRVGNYQLIWAYCLDEKENVYVADKTNLRIDKYDNKGNYLVSFGGIPHEAAKYPGWINTIAVDANGNLNAYSIAKRKFLIFSGDGKEFKTRDFNNELKNWYIKKMKFDKNDKLFLLGHSEKNGYQLLEYDLETMKYTVFHTDNKRIRPFFKDLLPDFDIDEAGDIYITDTIQYQIFKYSPTGQLIDRFFKKTKKIKIEDRDFNVLIRRGKVQKIPNYKKLWEKLSGASGFFPAIFGIHIDGKRIYTWTSNQDTEKKYLVDVYDLNFKYLCTTAHYNILGSNLAAIKNQRLYMPNIGSDNIDLKTAVGRFGNFNIPYKIEVFRISGKVLKK
jgi:hypothetical protein